MTVDVDTAVIGGGVIGLAIGRALALKGRQVMVLERHASTGAEVSSRSSEVIHAGLYYPPGSLKARLCVLGNQHLYAFADANGVAVCRTAKLIVATETAEIAALDQIGETARTNGVKDLVALSSQEARKLEPELRCSAALFSPSTGVIDSHGLMLALEGHLTALGGAVVLNTNVTGIRPMNLAGFEIETQSSGEPGRLTARNVVLAGGLGATRLGRLLEYKAPYAVPETYPAKGHYFSLRSRPPFRHLVYPVPSGGGLGIHLTLDVAGMARFGPDFEWASGVTYDFEDTNGARLSTFEREVRRYWPSLPDAALTPGTTGVRPKISRPGEPAADFAIHGVSEHGIAGLIALYGIDSPGLTSCLAIGDHVAGMLT